jgi:hypothetical protein
VNFIEEIQKYAEQPITTQILLGILKDFRRPYDKIDEMVRKGHIVQLKRGLYVPTDLLNIKGPEPFLIANHLYGPSYISLDSSLFHWGMIPERVFETTSVTTRISKTFKTKAGIFSYLHFPLPYYSFGMQKLSLTEKQIILIASPEKSICDKIISTSGILLRSKKQVVSYLIEELRIEKESLRNMNTKEMKKWLPDCPKRASIKLLIETLIDI